MTGRPLPARLALPFSFAIGLAYAWVVFGGAFAAGRGGWALPDGLIGGTPEMAMTLSGYHWFVQDVWRWPVFHIVQANPPGGVSAALMDPVPVIALPAKLWRSLTGQRVDLFPAWVLGCWAMSSLALTALVRGLGGRSLLATVLSGALGAFAPVVHFRYGHLPLAAHWIPVLSMAVYSWGGLGRRAGKAGVVLLALCALGFGASLYLFVMAAAVAAAFFVQAGVDRRLSAWRAIAGGVSVPGVGLVLLWAFGLADSPALAGVTVRFGEASMNLVAPFWPQSSGVFGWTGVYALTRGVIGATRAQYEGFCYLGAGGLLLLGIALWMRGRLLPDLVRRHWALTGALAALLGWAVSNRVYAGPILLAEVPLPAVLLDTVFAWFRASGRFAWPAMWMVLALGIAGTLASMRPRWAVGVAGLAMLLQWVEAAPLRERIAEMARTPHASAFGAEATGVAEAIGRLGRVVVVPSVHCTAEGAGDYQALSTLAAMEVQLMAGRSGAQMPGVALGRARASCERQALDGAAVTVVLRQPPAQDRSAEARAALVCRDVPAGLFCVPRAGASGSRATE